MGILDWEQLNFGLVHMVIKFWFLDLRPFLDGEFDLI
jgi:hypothetical protein